MIYTKLLCLKKRLKPPYAMINLNLLLVLLSLCACTHAQSSKEEQAEDDFEIITEPYWNALKFRLNNTEKYELQSVICKGKNSEETENTDNICENLLPCTSYIVTLNIINLKEENQLQHEITASTDYGEPMVEITGAEARTEELYLTWAATNQSCISSFKIELKSLDMQYSWKYENDQYDLLMGNLNPCREQNIQLFSYNIRDELISTNTISNTTLYAEPGKVSPSIEPYENAQVKVSWKEPTYYTCINYYYLRWFFEDCKNGGGGSGNNLTQTTAMTTVTENYDSTSLRATRATTMFHTSERISSLENKDHSNTEFDEAACEWSANLTISSSTPSITQHIIGNLQGCELYGLEIYINSDIVNHAEPTNFKAPEQIPGVVTIDTPVINATEMRVFWDPPTVNGKCLREYQVYLIGPLQREEDKQNTHTDTTDKTESFFNSLDPCGEYTLSVIPVSLNGTTGPALNSTFVMMEAKPSAVLNAIFVAEPQAINISWSSPIFADLCINGYRLSGWIDETTSNQNFDRETSRDETYAHIEGLFACQSYTVQIIPTTSNTDGEATQIEVETSAKVAVASNLQAISTYPNALELNAADENFDNKCETIIARFVCEETKSSNAIHKKAEQYVETLDRMTFKALLQPLSPNTLYRCNVYLFNTAGWSEATDIIHSTLPYYPDPPKQLVLVTSSNVSLSFAWESPTYPNGVIKLYIYYFQRVKAAYFVPPKCVPTYMEPIARETANVQLQMTKLLPYTTYSIQVAAQNEYGVGDYTRPFLVATQAWISDPVLQLEATPEGPYASETEYRANVVVTWMLPCQSNGEIELFIVDFAGLRADHESESFQRLVLPIFDESGKVTHNETNLKPEYTYSVTVAIKTRGIQSPSRKVHSGFESPAGIPQKLGDISAGKVQVNTFAADNPTKSAVVRFPVAMLKTESGTIMYAAILVSEKGCNPTPELRYGALNVRDSWPDTRTWSEVYGDSDGCIRQYQATEVRWNPLANLSPQNESEIIYTIGSEICSVAASVECGDYDDCADEEKVYCNGPLKPDTEYHLVLRLFTKSGYNDVTMLDFKTDALFQLTVIIISVCSCLLLAFIAGFVYIWVTKRMLWQRESCHGIEDSFGDVIAKNFAIYYRELSKPEKIAREFKELTLVAMDLSYAASELGSNKNRYADIFPYDKNRVILDIDAEGSDYINASFIDGYKRKKEYIATQGPKPESTMDFWRMVLQHNVRMIVMVTQFREGNEIKCHEYFPFKSKGINVAIKKKDSFEIYDRTEMSVTHEKHGLRRKVVHFYYKKWPDHGCPTDPNHLITFVRKVKTERVPSYSPIIVHCSAGVGRTGTFIGLDIIMQRLKYESKINIYETVKKLRFQRMKMVQTLAQYTLLYKCAYELVKHKNTRVNKKSNDRNENGDNSNGNNSSGNDNNSSSNSKKVSFQDDPELSIGTVPTKFHRRSDCNLSSVDEYDVDTEGSLSLPNNGRMKQLDEEALSYGSRQTRFSELSKNVNMNSVEDIASAVGGNNRNSTLTLSESYNESAM